MNEEFWMLFDDLFEFFPLQADPGHDADLVVPLHVAKQHGHHRHDAAHRQCHPGEPVWGPGDIEEKL